MIITSRYRGIASIVASAFGFALMAFFVRLCDDYGGAISGFGLILFSAVLLARSRR